MKKVFVIFALGVFTFSTVSCRETTENKVEDAANAAGEDMESGLDNAGDAVEDAANKTGDAVENAANETGEAMNNAAGEVEEEIEGTDDYNGDDDN